MRLRGNVPRERKCYQIPPDLRTKSTFVANDSRLDELSGLELGAEAGVGVVPRGRENDRSLVRAPDRVLEMGRKRAVRREDRPLVTVEAGIGGPDIQHRLDRETESGFDRQAAVREAVVRDLRLLVHRATDAVADEVA